MDDLRPPAGELLDLGDDGPPRCDGCGDLVYQLGPDSRYPVPVNFARRRYGRGPGELVYVVCQRGLLCLALALLYDELYLRWRRRRPRDRTRPTEGHPK